MPKPRQLTVVNVGYRSTNDWVVSAGTSHLFVDLGWPGAMGRMRASLKRRGVPLSEIKCSLATHYHTDHAGLAQELKQAGVPHLVLETQIDAIPLMKTWIKPEDHDIDFTMHDHITISCSGSRSALRHIDIPGEIVHTPGHSFDSVSLVLDDGSAFIVDLTPIALAAEEDAGVVAASWELLRERGALRTFPRYGPVHSIDDEAILQHAAYSRSENAFCVLNNLSFERTAPSGHAPRGILPENIFVM